MEIKCDSCKHHPVSCNHSMLYAVCLSRGTCRFQGEIDQNDGFHYSEFEPMLGLEELFKPKANPITLYKDDLERIYDEAFRHGMLAQKEGQPDGMPIMGNKNYHPEFVIGDF